MAMYDCIVMGAGIAGLTAARDLRNAGKRVLVLEASDQIGGRIKSKRDFVQTGSDEAFPVEEGADWIHVRNIKRYREFWSEIRKHGLRTDKFEKMDHNRVYFQEWGKPLTAADAALLNPSIWKMSGKKSGLFGKLNRFKLDGDDLGAEAFIASQGYTSEGHTLAGYSIAAHTPGLLNLISTAGLRSDRIPDQLRFEPNEYELRGARGNICGYNELPQAICREFLTSAQGLPKGEVKENHEIQSVEIEGGRVKVRCRRRSNAFIARSAICTFSVGFITEEHERVFGNHFPDSKKRALETVKMGKITKFMMQFKDWVWAPPRIRERRHVRRRGFEMAILSHPRGVGSGELGTFFACFPLRKEGPYILSTLSMGLDQAILESIPDDYDAARYVFGIIDRIYNKSRTRWRMEDKLVWRTDPGGRRVPNVYRKDWGKDPWARGGNSYIRYNPSIPAAEVAKARELLKSPLETMPIFWCGEATAPAYNPDYQPLSVHGAYISGYESAKDVGWYLNNSRANFKNYYNRKYALNPRTERKRKNG